MQALKILPLNSEAIIEDIELEPGIKLRLMELGFTKGTKVKALHKSAVGDTFAYGIKGTVIGLRGSETERILVNAIPAGNNGERFK